MPKKPAATASPTRIPPVLAETPDTIREDQILLVFESGACMVVDCVSPSHVNSVYRELCKILPKRFEAVVINTGAYEFAVVGMAMAIRYHGTRLPPERRERQTGPVPEHLREPVPGGVTQPAGPPAHLDPDMVRRAGSGELAPADLALNELPPGVE